MAKTASKLGMQYRLRPVAGEVAPPNPLNESKQMLLVMPLEVDDRYRSRIRARSHSPQSTSSTGRSRTCTEMTSLAVEPIYGSVATGVIWLPRDARCHSTGLHHPPKVITQRRWLIGLRATAALALLLRYFARPSYAPTTGRPMQP